MADPSPIIIANMLRQGLAQGQTPFLTISSDSMAPLLKSGDQVGLETAEISHLHPGDIITLVTEADLLTHRFWGLTEGQLRTRGDRSLLYDPLWSPDCLLGRVIVRRRNGRSLPLDSGRGKRLHRHLAWLVMAESYFLDKKWLVHFLHRAIYIWASIITVTISQISSKSSEG